MKTTESCPVCQNPETTIEHNVYDFFERPIHIEDCPECGKTYPVVCYDCPHCSTANKPNQHELLQPGLLELGEPSPGDIEGAEQTEDNY